MKNKNELLKFILSMLIFGTNGLWVAHISLSSAEIVLMRTLLGSLFLLAVVLLGGGFDFASLRKDLPMATLGGAALGMNWVFLFTAYREASVSLATLTYYCGPMLVLALSPLLFREKLTWNKLVAIAAVAAGMVFITGNIELGTTTAAGILWAGGAALLYAALIVCNKRVKHLSGLNCAMYELIVAFFVVLAYLVITGVKLPVIPAKSDIVYILAIGLLNTGLAYYLYFSSLQKLPGQTVALVCYLDPLTALLISAAVLNETLNAVQIVGAVLILGGACLGEMVIKSKRSCKQSENSQS